MDSRVRGIGFAAAIVVALRLLTPGDASAQTTQIVGAFEGCDYDKAYELADGQLLVCHEYDYSYSYMPTVKVLSGGRVLIDGEKFEASIENGRVVKTNVVGEFEGCDFDKYIEFANNLVFRCAEYNYTYAYQPNVRIIVRNSGYQVYIDNEKFEGTLYRH